jgi:hypothetical protein
MKKIYQLNQRQKEVKKVSHRKVKSDGLASYIFKILIILVCHVITGLYCYSIFGYGVIISLIEIIIAFCFISAAIASVAIEQDRVRDDNIIRCGNIYAVLPNSDLIKYSAYSIILLYIVSVVYYEYTDNIKIAKDESFTEMEKIEVNRYEKKLKIDTSRFNSLLSNALLENNRKIENEYNSRSNNLKYELAQIQKNIDFRNKNGFDNTLFLSQKRNIENRLSNIKAPEYLLKERSNISKSLNDSISNSMNHYTIKMDKFINEKNAKQRDKISDAKSKSFAKDVFILIIALIQHKMYYHLLLFLAMSKMSFFSFKFKSKPQSNTHLSLSRSQFAELLSEIIIEGKQVNYYDLSNWKRRNDYRLEKLSKQLEDKNIIIEFSKSGYVTAKKTA